MSYRKTFFFSNANKSISFEVSRQLHFGISLDVEGDEGHVTFHWWFLFSFWLIFEGFLPDKWYPLYYFSTMDKDPIHAGHRTISLQIHNATLWWNFWTNDNEWNSSTPKWRRGCFHFVEFVTGKKDYTNTEIEYKDFLLPYYEGNYKVRVVRNNAKWTMRRRLFWFMDINTDRYEVKTGYMNESNEWVDVPVPHEGKGENSWDCDEDATSSITFGVGNKNIRSLSDAAIEFWRSTMMDRIRYGGTNWLPSKFKEKQLTHIEA